MPLQIIFIADYSLDFACIFDIMQRRPRKKNYSGEGEKMTEKNFTEAMDEIGLNTLREDIVKALKSDDTKFVESVTIRTMKATEILRSHVHRGNPEAKSLLVDFSLDLLTDLANHAFVVKKPIVC